MPRITKENLIEEVEKLRKQNERLAQDRLEYFDLMTNAQLESERLKKQLSGVEQLEFDRDELLRQVGSLRAELETTKDKLKEARKTADECTHNFNDLKRKYSVARSTIEMQQHRLDRIEKELEAIRKSTRIDLFNISESINEQPMPKNPKRGRPITITPNQRQRILSLRKKGVTIRCISMEVGVSIGSVQRILNEEKTETEKN